MGESASEDATTVRSDAPPAETNGDLSLIHSIQALLLLMAMATWANHKAIFREAVAIRSILATLVRQDGLSTPALTANVSWEEWVRMESAKRTKFIVFCFSNLHGIVYNIPPSILNGEMNMDLPCFESEWKVDSASAWREVRRNHKSLPRFQDCFLRLFSTRRVPPAQAATLRSAATSSSTPSSSTSSSSVKSFAASQALKSWQRGWERNRESSLDPVDPHGPLAFNSTALLRIAYIRLSVDNGPGRAFETQDPVQIAQAMRESPPIKRDQRLTRAVLHSAHALSIPIKLGVNFVSATQMSLWSVQHSLCSLECAFLLSKWLEAVTVYPLEPGLSEDERRLLVFITNMLSETEFPVPAPAPVLREEASKKLSASVVRVWARIFRGLRIWDVVDTIGRALDVYADMLDGSDSRHAT
ncbi:hypothetical protein MMC08_004628 [Hypocenomyce scalaris]|nr:hypothetical protein [Hypocenomyce scalaris]